MEIAVEMAFPSASPQPQLSSGGNNGVLVALLELLYYSDLPLI